MHWLLDTLNFMPRTACGVGWSPGLQLVHEISDMVIFFCYLLIPIGVIGLYRAIIGGRQIPRLRLGVVLCGGFVLTCGLTHLMDRLMFQWPAYRLGGLVLAVCASFSVSTVAWMVYALGAPDGRSGKTQDS